MIKAFYGHHKCGSSWTWFVLSDLCRRCNWRYAEHSHDGMFNHDPVHFFSTDSFDLWAHSNANWTTVGQLDAIAVHVVRDPRDVIVSGYYSHLYSHPTDGLPAMQAHREQLKSVDKEAGLFLEMDWAAPYMGDMFSFAEARENPNILTLSYAQLVSNELLGFETMARHLGMYPNLISLEKLNDVVRAYSFNRLTEGRSRGMEDIKSPFRKGQPGDWRNHFDPKHRDYFKERYQPILELYGFEVNDSW